MKIYYFVTRGANFQKGKLPDSSTVEAWGGMRGKLSHGSIKFCGQTNCMDALAPEKHGCSGFLVGIFWTPYTMCGFSR